MRALKLLVIVMGVAIVVGVVVLVAVMAARLSGRGGPATAGGFGRTQVELPAGATIAEMQGAGDRLVLRLVVSGGPQQLLVIDTGSGKALGTIELRPQP
jgi:hypothetical protein